MEELNDAIRRAHAHTAGRLLLGESLEEIDHAPDTSEVWDLNTAMCELSAQLRRYDAASGGALANRLGKAMQAGVQRSFLAGLRAGARLAVSLLEGGGRTG